MGNKIKLWFFTMLFFFIGSPLLFSEGKPATELNKVVKTEGLTGINLFLAETYNNNRLLYAIISTVSVIVFGVIITYLIGLIIKPHASHEKQE